MPAQARCLSCGAEFPIEHKKAEPGAILRCPKCGDALSPAMISEDPAAAAAGAGSSPGTAPAFVKCDVCGSEVPPEKTFCPECGGPMKERWQPRAGLKPRGDLKRPPAEQLAARRQRLLALTRRFLKFPALAYFFDAVWIGAVDDRPVMISWSLCFVFLVLWWFGKRKHGPMVLAAALLQAVAVALALLRVYTFFPNSLALFEGMPVLMVVTTLFPVTSLVFWLLARRTADG